MFSSMEYVYEVYKERSFSKAAQNLYISQPSLSASVKRVEERIGVPVFDRGSNPLQLTECGKEYIKCVEKMLDIRNEFNHYIKDMNELKTGQLSIGASNYFASFILPSVITKFTERYPKVKVNLVEANSTYLEKKLLSGTLDVALDNSIFSSKIYTSYPYYKEHMLLAVPEQYASNEAVKAYQMRAVDIKNGKHLDEDMPSVPVENFRDDPFVFLRFGNDTRRRADKICQDAGFTPKIVLKLEQQVTAYHMARQGMGIIFVSDRLIQETEPDASLIFYKLKEKEAARTVYFYHKQSRYVTRAMEEFLKIAMEG